MRHPGGTCRHARHTDETCRRALRRAGVWHDGDLRVAPPRIDNSCSAAASSDEGEDVVGARLSPSSSSASGVEATGDAGAKLSSGSESGSEPQTADAAKHSTKKSKTWVVGANCGRWVMPGSPLKAQGTVLLLNVWENVRKLPLDCRRRVHECLCKGRGMYEKWSQVDSVVAAL